MATINIPSFQDKNVLIYNDFLKQANADVFDDEFMYDIDYNPVQASTPYQVDDSQTDNSPKSGPTGTGANEL